jgi:hypothetical protein
LVLAPALAGSALARADGDLELAGGISIPAGDSNWTNAVGTSPKLGVRIGDMWNDLGALLQVDWTPVNLNAQGFANPLASADLSYHVFRILANFAFQHHVLPHLVVGGRAGVGIDIARESGTVTFLGNSGSRSDTDVGLAVEVAGGVWYDFGRTQLGGELAVPIGHHDSPSQNGSYPFQYSSFDVDLLICVRLRGF